MRLFSKFFLVFVLLLAFSGLVKADPIVIQGGSTATSYFWATAPSSEFVFRGTDGSVFSGYSAGFFDHLKPKSYSPGTTLQPFFDFIQPISSQYHSFAFGGGIYQTGGVSVPAYYSALPPHFTVNFYAQQSFQLPTNGANIFSVQVPFNMYGSLSAITGCINDPFCPPTSLPGVQISGNGTATYEFWNRNGNYDLVQVNYTFSTPEPTPEPATILLLGTGLAVIVGFARRKLRNNK